MAERYKVVVVDDYRISRTFFEMMVQSNERYTLEESFSSAQTRSTGAVKIPWIW